jgi:hypothetical protein
MTELPVWFAEGEEKEGYSPMHAACLNEQDNWRIYNVNSCYSLLICRKNGKFGISKYRR